jgi:DNA-binding NarL/FixJ family response regulator
MLDLIARTRTLRESAARSTTTTTQLPTCSAHSGSFVRRYRSQGPTGSGVYPQCVPSNGDAPHLLSWLDEPATANVPGDLQVLTNTELEVLTDAANGLTRAESAAKRFKGSETVKTQRRSILLKLGARNMAQAVGMTRTNAASHE